MAQRRSKNRRSTNFSGVLDENTGAIDNRDLLWANRTSVRPSTSFNLSKEASPILTPNSDVNATVNKNWYKDLSPTDSLKMLRSASKRHADLEKEKQIAGEESQSETESNKQFEKKRRRIALRSKKNEQSEKSDVFSKALDKSESSSKNSSKEQTSDKNENKLTNDDPEDDDDVSKTQKKLKPKLFKAPKSRKSVTSKFYNALESDSSSKNEEKSKSLSKSKTSEESRPQTRFSLKRNKNESPGPNDADDNSDSQDKSKTTSTLKESSENGNDSTLKGPSCTVKTRFEASNRSKNKEKNQNSETIQKSNLSNVSALRDIQNTMLAKKPRIALKRITVLDPKDYIPREKIVGKPIASFNVQPNTTKSPNKKKKVQQILDSEDSEGNPDDLLQTPTPGQSTLNFQGKPVNRVSLRWSAIPGSIEKSKQKEATQQQNEVNEDVEVDVEALNESNPKEIRGGGRPRGHLFSPVSEKNKSKTTVTTTDDEGVKAFLNETPTETRKTEASTSFDPSVWEEVKKKTDALKERIEAQDKRKKQEQREQEMKKAAIDAKLRRNQAQREAERKRKLKKPLDKAFYVNGKPYKQPRLPKPKKWVTERLYKHLWKAMEPKFGLKTRVKSEKFVLKLSNIYTVIVRRTKFDNYANELSDLLNEMAKLGIIENRYDFYRFCSDFMPPNFKDKVVPMMLPGNKRNIPYDPEIVYDPILDKEDSRRRRSSRAAKNSRREASNDGGEEGVEGEEGVNDEEGVDGENGDTESASE